MKSTGKPTAITMCIGPSGDRSKVSPGDCAVRLAEAGMYIYRTLNIQEISFSKVVEKWPMWNIMVRGLEGCFCCCCCCCCAPFGVHYLKQIFSSAHFLIGVQ